MKNRPRTRPPIWSRTGLNIEQLDDDATAIKHVKKPKFSNYRFGACERKTLKQGKIKTIKNFKQY